MKNLSEIEIIKIIRNEYKQKLDEAKKRVHVTIKPGQQKSGYKDITQDSEGAKIVHTDSGIEYQIIKVSGVPIKSVVLRSADEPAGNEFEVSASELKDYSYHLPVKNKKGGE
jgi:hypothetical protein